MQMTSSGLTIYVGHLSILWLISLEKYRCGHQRELDTFKQLRGGNRARDTISSLKSLMSKELGCEIFNEIGRVLGNVH